jgi:acyl phosphate:glycerol-3-phosphate acyltransferase
MRVFAALAIGYLLGSVLPAYFIGRSRGIDMQKVGSGNAGTTNAYHILGLGPAVFTAAYDVLKGIIAMLVAWRLGVTDPVIYAAGLAAWVGHHFPFYLGYHGAEGIATTLGLLAAAAFIGVARGWFGTADLAIVAVAALAGFAIARSVPVSGIASLVVGYAIVLLRSPSPAYDVFVGAAAAQQLVHNVNELRQGRGHAAMPLLRRRRRSA